MRKSLLYILIAIAASFALRYLLHEGIRRNSSGVYGKFNTAFAKKNKYDVVFIGSSRAETHFDCRIADSMNNTDSYNLGMEGASIVLSCQVLKAYLTSSAPPRHVVLSVDHVFNYEKADTVFMYPRYFPYLGNRELYKGLYAIDKRFAVFRYVPFYSMAHMGPKYLQASLYGYLGKKPLRDTGYYKGFFPFPDTIFRAGRAERYRAVPDAAIEAYVDSIGQLCRSIHAQLHVVVCPVYRENYRLTAGVEQNILRLRQACSASGYAFYDYSQPAYCADSRFFYDGFHLNGRGARRFTREFSADFHNKMLK